MEKGTEYVGVMHHEKYPIYVSYLMFEAVYNFYPHWQIPHDARATRFAFGISKVFTNMCRKSDHEYEDIPTQYNNIIWRHNKPTISTGVEEMRFYMS